MNFGFITWCVLAFVGLLLNARDHGKPKTGTDSFWLSLLATAIMTAVILWAMRFRL
jgi:LPXTG-motif cell wall-anchored protein